MAWGVTAGLLVILVIIQVHPPLMWLGGSALAWRLVTTAAILGFIGWIWACRGKGKWHGLPARDKHGQSLPRDHRWDGHATRPVWQWAMFVVGLAAFMAFAMGGFVRERSKSPDTVYGEIIKPELTDNDADRFLVYDKWLKPRNEMPEDLVRKRPESWRTQVERARRDGLELTDDQAERIIRYLEANN
jgi:hypothetical protein